MKILQMNLNRKLVEIEILKRLKKLTGIKVNYSDVAIESYKLANDEIIIKTDVSGRSLPNWVMAYFYGYREYTGMIVMNEQQTEILRAGILNEYSQLIWEVSENEKLG